MIIGTIPPDIATMEQLITWGVSELRRELSEANPSAQYPQRITEAQGYFPSEVIAIQEISTIDGGSRHILRILMPVAAAYYGANQPVYQFCGQILP